MNVRCRVRTCFASQKRRYGGPFPTVTLSPEIRRSAAKLTELAAVFDIYRISFFTHSSALSSSYPLTPRHTAQGREVARLNSPYITRAQTLPPQGHTPPVIPIGPCFTYLSFFVSPLPSALTASSVITCPYSFTRLGSMRYIHRCVDTPHVRPVLCAIDSAFAHLVQEYQKHEIVPEAREPMEGWHLDAEPVEWLSREFRRAPCDHIVTVRDPYANRSSTTVDKVL